MQVKKMNIKLDDVIEWLEDKPKDAVVHNDSPNLCEECLFANYLKELTGNDNIHVRYASADDEDDMVTYHLPMWVARTIPTVDKVAHSRDDQQLTAENALELLNNLDREMIEA